MTPDTFLFGLINGSAGQSSLLDDVGIFFAVYAIYILALVALALRRKNMVLQGALAVTISLLAENVIRFFWQRLRPFVTSKVNVLITHPSSLSFPSTHSAISFALAQTLYSHNRKLGIYAYFAATLIALSRVFVGVHYPTDILAGAIIGIASGVLAERALKRNN